MAWEMKPDTGDGVLFWEENKRNERGPDIRGNMTLDVGLLRLLVAEAKAGRPIKIDLAGWNRTTRTGNPMLSLTAQMPREKTAAPQQTRPAAPPVQQRAPAPVVQMRPSLDESDIPF